MTNSGTTEQVTWPCRHPACTPLGDTRTEHFNRIEPTECQLARMAEHGLCPECKAQWAGWLDYKIVSPINIVQTGRPTATRMREAQAARTREWMDTINFQQRLIARICTIRHNWTGEEN
jgi:hypothetical protein